MATKSEQLDVKKMSFDESLIQFNSQGNSLIVSKPLSTFIFLIKAKNMSPKVFRQFSPKSKLKQTQRHFFKQHIILKKTMKKGQHFLV